MKKILFFFMMVLFLFASTSSSSSSTSSDELFELVKGEIGDILPVLIFLLILILAVVYMFGVALNRVEWKVYAKTEFYHLFLSIFLLVSFASIVGFFNAVSNFSFNEFENKSQISFSCSGTLQSKASCYSSKMKNDLEKIIHTYTQRYIEYLQDSAAYINLYTLDKGFTISTKGYRKTHAMFIDNVLNMFVLPAYMSISAQAVFVDYFFPSSSPSQSPIFTILLPGAFLLRFTPPLRKAGNFLLVFSLSLYVLLPFLIALNGAMYDLSVVDCTTYNYVFDDVVLGDCGDVGSFYQISKFYPYAFLLPNFIIFVISTATMSGIRLLEVFS